MTAVLDLASAPAPQLPDVPRTIDPGRTASDRVFHGYWAPPLRCIRLHSRMAGSTWVKHV